MLLIVFLSLLTVIRGTNLPFSWDTVPTFAFPGADSTFYDETAINEYNLTAFQQILNWGMNCSCYDTDGHITPADFSGSYYSCPDNMFYPNMETSLQHQAELFKKYMQNYCLTRSYFRYLAPLVYNISCNFLYFIQYYSIIIYNIHECTKLLC